MWAFGFEQASSWAPYAIGFGVAGTVFWLSGFVLRSRRERRFFEEGLPWEDLLEQLKNQQRKNGGELPDTWDKLSPGELLKLVLKEIPKAPANAARVTLDFDDADLAPAGGRQRRASRRRWLNPTEVTVTSPLNDEPHRGLVFNRSTGGLAVLTDEDHALDSILFVKPAEAPSSVPPVKVGVRHSRQAGGLWVVGCQYLQDIPWNTKVWFG